MFVRKDLSPDKKRAWCILGLGILVFLVGRVSITLILTGTIRFYPYIVFCLFAGIALIGIGWTNLRELRALERERRLREHRHVASTRKSV